MKNLDIYEHFAKIVLSHYALFGQTPYCGLQVRDKPDLQSDIEDIGIEVRRILPTIYPSIRKDGTFDFEHQIVNDTFFKDLKKYDTAVSRVGYPVTISYDNTILCTMFVKFFHEKEKKLQQYTVFHHNVVCFLWESFDISAGQEPFLVELLQVFCASRTMDTSFSMVYLISVFGFYGFDLQQRRIDWYAFAEGEYQACFTAACAVGGDK